MNHYDITFIHGSVRTALHIIATNSRAATRIAMGIFEDTDEPCCVICKPLGSIA